MPKPSAPRFFLHGDYLIHRVTAKLCRVIASDRVNNKYMVEWADGGPASTWISWTAFTFPPQKKAKETFRKMRENV